jgi:hypothetical protein
MVSPRTFGRGLVLALVVFAAVVPASPAGADGNGPVVGPEVPVSRPVPGSPRNGGDQAMAYGGGVHLVAWVDGRGDLRATRVDRNGAVVDATGILLSTADSNVTPAVAFDGTNFLVVWDGSGVIQGRRVSPGGVVLDAAPIELSSAGGARPEVSFGGDSYLVVWTAVSGGTVPSDVFASRLTPDGVVLQPANIPIVAPDGVQSNVDIAFDGTHHLLVWDQLYADPPNSDVGGTLVTTEGVALGPGQTISSAEEVQWKPVVTATGSGFFVAWQDYRERTDTIYGARVGADGSVLDDAGIRIGTTTYIFSFAPTHDVASDGVNAFVTWATGEFGEETQIRGARVDPTGAVLDPGGVVLATGQQPVSAFDGTNHLVTSTSNAPAYRLTGTRVTPGLTPLDPGGFVISLGANGQLDIELASDGVNQFVVWTDDRNGHAAVYGARVGPDGQNLDGTGFPISVPGATASSPSVAFDGTNFLVVWVGSGVQAARVSPAGEVLDRFEVTPQPFSDPPTVAFGNGMFLVGWVRFEEVMVTRVAIDGTVLDPEGILLWSNLSTLAEIDIAAGASEFLVVWNAGRAYEPTDDNDVHGAVVTLDGTVVMADVPVAQEPFPIHEDDPAVAWHDGTYLLVWSRVVENDDGTWPPEVTDIYGARVDATGTVLDPSPLPISTAPGDQGRPDIAINGRFLVTWLDRRRSTSPGDPTADAYGSVVDPAGTVEPEFLIGATDTRTGSFFATAGPVATAVPGTDDFAVAYGRHLPDEPYLATRAFLRRVSPK